MTKRELLAIALGMILAVYGVLSHAAEKTSQKAAASQQVAQQATEQNQKFQQVTQAQIESLQKSNELLSSQLQKQQTADSKLPPKDLGQKLISLAQLPASEVVLEPTGHFDLSQAAVLTVTQDLEALPVVSLQLKNTQAQLTLERASHKSDIDADGKQIQALKDEVSSVKANARKSKLKWFGAGVIVGFVGAEVLHFHGTTP